MVMLKALVVLPAIFSALTVKLNEPAIAGLPIIVPVPQSRAKPGGKLLVCSDQNIGVVPVALSV